MELLGRSRGWRRRLTVVDTVLAEKDATGTVEKHGTEKEEVHLAEQEQAVSLRR